MRVATRHCNSRANVCDEGADKDGVGDDEGGGGDGDGNIIGDRGAANTPIFAALARLETMTFLAPMHIGEVAQLEARVTLTSRRSIEVAVSVWAESPARPSARRLTNRARLWYVAVASRRV